MIRVAPSEKGTANDTLEKRLWAAADQFRATNGLSAAQYSQPVLGLIFLRFAEVRFAVQRAKLETPSPVADFAEKFEELIESYNAGSRNIEELFQELPKLSRSRSEEQKRHVRENVTEEELMIFDILTRPGPELSSEESGERSLASY